MERANGFRRSTAWVEYVLPNTFTAETQGEPGRNQSS